MNYNNKRHKLLKELTKLITNREENRNNFDCNEVSMTFKQIDKFLDVSRQEREIILSELWKSKEILLCEFPNNYNGCFINDSIGISSFSNKKYLDNNNEPENKSITNNFYNNSIGGDNLGAQSINSDFTKAKIEKDTTNPKISESKIWTISNVIFAISMGLIVGTIIYFATN